MDGAAASHDAQQQDLARAADALLARVRPALGHPQNAAERDTLGAEEAARVQRAQAAWDVFAAHVTGVASSEVCLRSVFRFIQYNIYHFYINIYFRVQVCLTSQISAFLSAANNVAVHLVSGLEPALADTAVAAAAVETPKRPLLELLQDAAVPPTPPVARGRVAVVLAGKLPALPTPTPPVADVPVSCSDHPLLRAVLQCHADTVADFAARTATLLATHTAHRDAAAVMAAKRAQDWAATVAAVVALYA